MAKIDHPATILAMARAGLAGETKRVRWHIAQLRNALFADADPRLPDGSLTPDDQRRRELARELSKLLNTKPAVQPPQQDVGVPPTAEVYARRMADPIARMHKAGKISDHQLQAAHDIQVASECVAGVVRATMLVPKVDTSHRPKLNQHGHAGHLLDLYNRWLARLVEEDLPAGPLLDVIQARRAIREIEEKWLLRHGTLGPVIPDALEVYVKLAGLDRRSGTE